MSDTYLKAAFEEACTSAVKPQGFFVTMYEHVPFYGGPEEGGWWGNDTVVAASQHFGFKEEAEKALAKVKELAEQFSATAKKAFNQQCANECDWLEKRGLEDGFLPEVDGETRYTVMLETERGASEHHDERYYS